MGLKGILLLTAMVALAPAAPPPESRIDVTNRINNAFADYYANMTGPVALKPVVSLAIDIPLMAQGSLKLNGATLDIRDRIWAYDSSYTSLFPSAGDNVTLHLKALDVVLNIPNYVINGTIVDHMHLEGDGPGSIIIDDLDITVTGQFESAHLVGEKPRWFQLSSATLDLDLHRWTMNLQNLMPGTDLGAVFNEFFSMCGPELMDLLEIKMNESGSFLAWANALAPPPTTATTQMQDL